MMKPQSSDRSTPPPASTRRRFIQTTVAASASGILLSGNGGHRVSAADTATDFTPTTQASNARPLFVATWPFGKKACERAVEIAQAGKPNSMFDAVEKGIWVVEADVKNASVGIGGIPNADGAVELDACIMGGPNHTAGSVAAIQDILHPISVARKVMDDTIHVMLAGEGARQFALENGFQKTELLTDQQKSKWEKWKREQKADEDSDKQMVVTEDQHDTIAMIGIDEKGDLYGGCSTSGWGYKIPGRVGDSPILGSGLFVDNTVGAAGATGVGENVMRYCGSFLIVEFMRQGASPTDACQKAIERIAQLDPKGIGELDINFVALNKKGEFGAAGTSTGFKYSYAHRDGSDVLEARALSEKAIGPEGGNRK